MGKLRREFVGQRAKLNGTPDTARLSSSEAFIQPWTNEEINKVFDHYNKPRNPPPSSPYLPCLPLPASFCGFLGFALN